MTDKVEGPMMVQNDLKSFINIKKKSVRNSLVKSFRESKVVTALSMIESIGCHEVL